MVIFFSLTQLKVQVKIEIFTEKSINRLLQIKNALSFILEPFFLGVAKQELMIGFPILVLVLDTYCTLVAKAETFSHLQLLKLMAMTLFECGGGIMCKGI